MSPQEGRDSAACASASAAAAWSSGEASRAQKEKLVLAKSSSTHPAGVLDELGVVTAVSALTAALTEAALTAAALTAAAFA
eukprot:5032672-Pleurochrysis_carterae.AAC.2